MRCQILIPLVIGFAIASFVAVSRLHGFIQLFFEHSGIAITQAEIAIIHNSTTLDPRPQLIPKIIHQVFHDWRNVGMPSDWEGVRKSCIEKNKEWEYMVETQPPDHLIAAAGALILSQLWTEESSREFIREHYGWFLKTYDGYSYPVQRIDTVRYFLLLHYGGIYLDLDNVSSFLYLSTRILTFQEPSPFSNVSYTQHLLSSPLGMPDLPYSSSLHAHLHHGRWSWRPQQQHPRLGPQPSFLGPSHLIPHPIQLQLLLPLRHHFLRQRAVVLHLGMAEIPWPAGHAQAPHCRCT